MGTSGTLAPAGDMEGKNAEDYGYKPILDITRTSIYNNGKWVEINIQSRGKKMFALEFAKSLYQTNSVISTPTNITKAFEWIKSKF